MYEIRLNMYGQRAKKAIDMLYVNFRTVNSNWYVSSNETSEQRDRRAILNFSTPAVSEDGCVVLKIDCDAHGGWYKTNYWNGSIFTKPDSTRLVREFLACQLDPLKRSGGKIREVTYCPTYGADEIRLMTELIRTGTADAKAYGRIANQYMQADDPLQCEINSTLAAEFAQIDKWADEQADAIVREGRRLRAAALREIQKKIYDLRLALKREVTAKKRAIKDQLK